MFLSLQSGKPIKASVFEYSRGVAGGLLFSFPLLYTEEVWEVGFINHPQSLLVLVVVTFILLLGYNRFAGMHPDSTWPEIIMDSVEEMGLGFVISFLILLMLNRIQLDAIVLSELVGKVTIEGMAISIGVSIGTAQLEAKEDEDDEARPDDNNKTAIIVLAFCGAIVVGGNVAPTGEILIITLEAEPLHIFLMAIISMLLSIVIVYFSNFRGTSAHREESFFKAILYDTIVCYSIALLVSAFLLWFFNQFGYLNLWHAIAQCVVLGVLTSLGSSAGRLLIK